MKKIKLDELPKNASASNVPVNTGNVASAGSKKAGGQWWKILIAVLCAVYMFVPELTDAVPVIGWLDELVAGAVSVISTISAIKNGRYNPNSRMEQRADDIFGKDNF